MCQQARFRSWRSASPGHALSLWAASHPNVLPSSSSQRTVRGLGDGWSGSVPFQNCSAANPSCSLKCYANVLGVKSIIPGMIWLKIKRSSSQRMDTPFPFYPEQTRTSQNTSKQKLETYEIVYSPPPKFNELCWVLANERIGPKAGWLHLVDCYIQSPAQNPISRRLFSESTNPSLPLGRHQSQKEND